MTRRHRRRNILSAGDVLDTQKLMIPHRITLKCLPLPLN